MINLFKEQLQNKVLSVNQFDKGTRYRRKSTALNYKYLGLNQKYKQFICLDVDRPNSSFDWEDRGLPPPSIITISRDTGRCHVLYRLKTPVIYTEQGRRAPQRFYEAVDASLSKHIGADPAYIGLLTKNPFHPAWKTITHNVSYDLRDFGEWFEIINPFRIDRTNPDGRNCTLFDILRYWAYVHVKHANDFDIWQSICQQKAFEVNSGFPNQLPAKEILSVSKSVANYCWRNRGRDFRNRGILSLPQEMSLKEKQQAGAPRVRIVVASIEL